jgi:hypothetical protein
VEDQSTQKPTPTPPTPIAKEPPAKAEAAPAEKDLSQLIERAVDREPMDQVKCVRVFSNYYRCNWWSKSTSPKKRTDTAWGGEFMDCIRKSRFLTATMQTGELVITEVPSVAPYHTQTPIEK